jgi:transcriptional regulator with XRE-family HTH domain
MRRMPETEQDAAELRRMEFQMLYGERVREARTAAGVKQDALADRLGLTRLVGGQHRGRPAAQMLRTLAEDIDSSPLV